MKILLAFALFISLIGCAKNNDDPAKPVVNYYKALAEKDSAALVNSFTLKEKKAVMSIMGVKTDFGSERIDNIKIKNVAIDNSSPDLARVYVSGTYKNDSTTHNFDSLFFYVAKEDGEWKMTSYSLHNISDTLPIFRPR